MNFSNKLLILLRGYETSYQGISKHHICKNQIWSSSNTHSYWKYHFPLNNLHKVTSIPKKIYVNITRSWEKSLSSLQKTNKTGPVCFLWKPDLNVNVWKLKRFAYICQYIYIYTQWKRVPTWFAIFSKYLQKWSQRC